MQGLSVHQSVTVGAYCFRESTHAGMFLDLVISPIVVQRKACLISSPVCVCFQTGGKTLLYSTEVRSAGYSTRTSSLMKDRKLKGIR